MHQGTQQGQGGSNNSGGASAASRTLSLVKGNQQFCFRYQVGEESKVLEALVEWSIGGRLPVRLV